MTSEKITSPKRKVNNPAKKPPNTTVTKTTKFDELLIFGIIAQIHSDLNRLERLLTSKF